MADGTCIALLLAGGRGSRMRLPLPKQYVEVAGRPVLGYALSAFARHPGVGAVYVVCAEEWSERVSALGRHECGGKFRGTFRAGTTAFESLRNGVEGLRGAGWSGGTMVVVHDGVRPLVSRAVISSCIETCAARGSAVAALQGNEAFLESADACQAWGYRERERLYRAQTPMAFSLQALEEAFAEARRRGLPASQSLFTLMAELGRWPVFLSHGETANFKITLPEDVALFRALVEGGFRMAD